MIYMNFTYNPTIYGINWVLFNFFSRSCGRPCKNGFLFIDEYCPSIPNEIETEFILVIKPLDT